MVYQACGELVHSDDADKFSAAMSARHVMFDSWIVSATIPPTSRSGLNRKEYLWQNLQQTPTRVTR